MQLFYTTNIHNQLATLEAEEARHLQVLRKKVGDPIHLVDGKGSFHIAELLELRKKEAQLKILSSKPQPPSPFSLHIAIAPTKNIARLEWFLEKATEIGIQEITPIYCEHSERKRIRLDRLEKIVLSAMKQSNRAYLPKLNEETTFKQFVAVQKEQTILKYIAHCEEEEKVELYNNYQVQKDVLVMIGPEGNPIFRRVRGISRDEVLKTAFQFRETITNPVLRRSDVYKQPAQKLYNWIVRPLLEELDRQNISTLLFAPDAGLRSLPFAALHDGEQFLVERFSLGVTPSINLTDTQYVDLRSAPVLAMGASEFGEGLSPLPAVPVELESIAGTERSTEILLNDEFTVDQLRTARDRNPAPIVHLATHGEFNSTQPLQGALALTPDAQNDGFLTAAEILEQPLQASLAILSACDTGRGRITGDGVIGLSRSFMAAGVPQVVVSLWQVPDQQTADLMIDFHTERLKQGNTPQALREAMLSAIATYPDDPALWAAFVQVGSAP